MPHFADLLLRALQMARSTIPLSAGGLLRRSQDGRLVFHDIQQRETLLREVNDIYNGNWWLNIDPMPGQPRQEAIEQPGQIRLQYLRSWTDTLATTYQQEPIRTFRFKKEPLPEGDKRLEALQAAYDEMDVDVALEKIDRFMYLFGNVATRITYNPRLERLDLHIFPSFQTRVVDDPLTPASPIVTVLLGTILERDRFGAASRVETAEIWVEPNEEFPRGQFRRIGVDAVPWEPLVTQRPPLIHFANEKQDNETGFFVRSLGIVLARLNVAINEDYLNQLGYTMLMQAHGQMQIFGLEPGKKIEIGPARAVSFSGDPTLRQGIEYANAGADLGGIQDTIRMLIDEIQTVYRIPVRVVEAGEGESGKAKIEARAPTMEARIQRIKLFRKPETDLMRSTLDMERTFRGLAVPGKLTDYDVVVTFAKPAIAVTADEAMKQEDHDIKLGLVEPAELLMRRRPDEFDSVEEAREHLAEKKAAQPETGASNEPPAVPGEPGSEHNSGHEDEEGEVVVGGNPWRIEKRGEKFAVVKVSDGKVAGTHDTLAEAKAQLAALEASEDE